MNYKLLIILPVFLSYNMYAQEGKPDSVELEIPPVVVEIEHED